MWSPTGYWSCKFPQSLLKPHCSILKFLTAPLTPPGNHTAHGCFFALPSHSHLCLDEETWEIVTAFIIISTVDDLTWTFSPVMAASKLTRIWGVCLFGKPVWAWPANPKVDWGIGLQISFPQETILYLKLCFIWTEIVPFLCLLLAFKRSLGLEEKAYYTIHKGFNICLKHPQNLKKSSASTPLAALTWGCQHKI